MRISKKLLSFAAILLLLASLLLPLIRPGTAHADPVGQSKWTPIPITTCAGLQAINDAPESTYTLSNDLNCTASGFTTITAGFSGRFYGQGHTISNLGAPLFGDAYSAIITNLNIVGDIETTQSGSIGILANNFNFGLVSDVHVTGVATMSQAASGIGGLFGNVTYSAVTRSSANLSVQVEAAQAQIGGLAVGLDNTQIQDSYAVLNIDASAGGVEHAGGLAAYGTTSKIINSYTSGSITSPGNIHEIGGLVWYGASTVATNSFSTLQGAGICNGTDGCSGLITVADGGLDLSTDYFDQTAVGSNFCTGNGLNNSCNRVNTDGSQPNYFMNNTTNGPLNSWDFSGVWATSVGLPVLRNFSDPSPAPDPVDQLTANIGSSTSIDLSWVLPGNTGSSPVLAREVYSQKVGESQWSLVGGSEIRSYSTPSENVIGTTFTAQGLDPGTSYNFEVVLYNQDGYLATATTTGVTAMVGFHVINTCQQLQDVTNNPIDNYELGRNIDCSDSVNWFGGEGFAPIGCLRDQGEYMNFTGNFIGNNYTISNLYIDGGYLCYVKALFGSTRNALVQDFSITNPVVQGSFGNNYSNAIVTVRDRDSTFNNIHISAVATGDEQMFAGGLIGSVNGSGTTINRVSFVGTLSGDLGSAGIFGGLIGAQSGNTTITDSYAQTNFNHIGLDSYGGSIGGLVGRSSDPLTITNSYAALNYDGSAATISDSYQFILGGLIGPVYDNQPTITNSFARTQVQGYTGDTSMIGGLFGFQYNYYEDGQPDPNITPTNFSGNYFDADTVGTSQCAGSIPGVESIYSRAAICDAVTGQPNYFYNNSTNPPLNSWDFNNIWQTTSTLPVFGSKVLTTITPIPAGRLKPPVLPTTPEKVIIPSQPIVKVSEVTAQKKAESAAAATSANTEPKGIIAELKKLLSYVPTAVLVNFPYILFGLLLLAALALLIEMLRQANRLKQLNLLLAEQRSVAEKRDTFWHLAANYLRAPITLLMGGADLLTLSKKETPETKQLTALSQKLQVKVANIMKQIECSHTLQGIKPPKEEKPRRVWSSVGFWLPLITVAVLIVLTNYVAHSWRNLQISTISLVSQVLLYLLVTYLMYWVLSSLGVVNRRRRDAELLLMRQEEALDNARLQLMRRTAHDLDADVTHLQALLAKLSPHSQAKPIAQEGASRLRHLIDSFHLLITAQNHRLSGLSPSGAQTSLDRVFKEALAELEPDIAAKHLTIDMPTKQGLRVPGNHDLNTQVLSSVLSNAVAFSHSGSTIGLILDQTEAGVRLTVLDHGPGITPSQQSHLFEPFTKADGQTGLQLDHGGLGISLYLDRQVMDYLGGQITVNSQAGQGTAVELQWPQVAPKHVQPGAVVQPTSL